MFGRNVLQSSRQERVNSRQIGSMLMTRSHYKVKRSMIISLALTHDHWSVPDSTAERLAAVVGAAQG